MVYSTQQENRDQLTPFNEPIQTGAGAVSSGVETQGTETDITPGATGPLSTGSGTTTTQGSVSSPRPVQFGHTGTASERLLQPLTQGYRSARGDLSGAVGTFRGGAGPSRTFESIGGQGILEAGSQPGAPLDPGRNLVTAHYAGPTGLDTNRISSALGTASSLAPVATGLGRPQDLPTLLGLAVPGLTPGQATFEAQILQSDPDFLRRLNQSRGRLSSIRPSAESAVSQASQFAQKRASEEADISRRSLDYLTQQTTGLQDELQQIIQQREEGQQSVRDLFNEFQATDLNVSANEIPGVADIFDILDLQNVGHLDEYGRPLNREDITASPLRLRRNLALQALQSVINEYPERVGDTIKSWVAPQGQTGWSSAADYAATQVPWLDRPDSTRQRGYDRHLLASGIPWEFQDPYIRDLTRLFGHGGLPGLIGEGGRGEHAVVLPLFGDEPESNPIAPLWGGVDLTPVPLTDIRPFLGLQEGTTPTLGNVSTQEQRDRFEQQNLLLGLEGRIANPLVEYRDPALTYNVAGLHQADIDTLNQRDLDLANYEIHKALTSGLALNKTTRLVGGGNVSFEDDSARLPDNPGSLPGLLPGPIPPGLLPGPIPPLGFQSLNPDNVPEIDKAGTTSADYDPEVINDAIRALSGLDDLDQLPPVAQPTANPATVGARGF